MKKIIRDFMQKKLAEWAGEVYQKKKPYVIAVTGSIAKTSTKEAVFAVLRQQYSKDVFCNPGNLNNEFGLPLAILGFNRSIGFKDYLWVIIKGWFVKTFKPRDEKYWVLEMGADKPGDIEYLINIARPNMAVVTAVGASHLQNLKSVEGVFEEKSVLVKSLDKNGVAILNELNGWVKKMADKTEAKVIFFKPGIDAIAQEAAKTVGREIGVSQENIDKALENIKLVTGRMNIDEIKEDVWLIDDSYNANPLSMEVALYKLDKLSKEKKAKRRIAVLGDMLDLGDYTVEAHQKLKPLIDIYCDYVIGIGESMGALDLDEWYENSDFEGIKILNKIERGDIILVKGSRGIKLEKIVQRLK